MLAAFGHTWQPFGGSGYLLLFALLALVLLLSGLLIGLPPAASALACARRSLRAVATPQIATGRELRGRDQTARALIYFALIGIAFLFVEIPLIQRWILPLEHPTYAFTVVVLTLLLFSSMGSSLARTKGLPRRALLAGLVILGLLTALGRRARS